MDKKSTKQFMRRLFKRIGRSRFTGGIVVVIFVILIPIILIVLLVALPIRTWWRNYKIRKSICISCGKVLGTEAIRLGNERWNAMTVDLMRKFPGSKFKRYRSVYAVCPHCGTEYGYRKGAIVIHTPRVPPFDDQVDVRSKAGA